MTLEGAGYEKAAEAVQRLFYHDMDDNQQELDSYAEMAQEHYEAERMRTAGFPIIFFKRLMRLHV